MHPWLNGIHQADGLWRCAVRGMIFGTLVLVGLAITDLWFSSRLLAQAQSNSERNHSVVLTATAETEDSVQLVEQALNSRYMQWGAVGVMLGLFTWIITKQQPNQEKRREAERREERAAFLTSLEKRDSLYLESLSELRRSVESHSERHHEAKERLTVAVNNLTNEVKSGR